MKEFRSSIAIDAPPERIWAILTDAPGWTSWNTTVDKIDGTIALGQKVTVHAKISPGRAFPVKVTELVPNERMVWSSGMPFGLFTGRRTFTLAASGGGASRAGGASGGGASGGSASGGGSGSGASSKTEFAMHEVFSGPLSGLIGKSIPDLQPAFDEFARALKTRAESGEKR